ncbi:hypothetical protein Nepgr_009809 [Nepenthes gracilis]|uniref:RING-type E3 ubiquitin transferase n=1 Tax=Nepenthes gracilis TaxID=150966 RepID=A0AAD3SC28_NEPGR|nr:hypothetical protein Nepgr_009809 [Nepenthes gracilis]
MGSGKHWWKLSIHRSKSTNKPHFKNPPNDFICPISGNLMADPVIVSSGQTYERACVQACKILGFTPSLKDGSVPDFSTIIPNLALKSTILNWANHSCPKPVELDAALELVHSLMPPQEKGEDEEKRKKMEISEGLIGNMIAKPNLKPEHAVTELTRHRARFDSDESLPNSLPSTPMYLATRPRCYSSSSSSEIETISPRSWDEEPYVSKLRSLHVHEQEEAVISLRKATRTSVESRSALCTPRLLSALQSLIISKYCRIQVNSIAALVNLSLEKSNKVKIVRAGIVPPLVDVLSGGFPEAQEHASGAIFSLALDDDNKTAIGALGALPPLIHMMRSSTESARHDSALALYHLSLARSNRTKLVKLGLVPVLLGMVRAGQLTGRVLLILCNLGACSEGRASMLDGGAVRFFLQMLRKGEFDSESTRDRCVAALCALSHGGLRFKGLASAAGAEEVLRKMVEEVGCSKWARGKAKRLLEVFKAREEAEDVDWEKVLDSGFPSQAMS